MIRRTIFYFVLFFQLANAETYWVRYGWEIFANAGDGRSLALGNTLTASGGGAIGPLFNPALDPGISEFGLTYAHQSRFAGLINSDLGAFRFRIPFAGRLALSFFMKESQISRIHGIFCWILVKMVSREPVMPVKVMAFSMTASGWMKATLFLLITGSWR